MGRMITNFKIFELNTDIDPYGEEIWNDNEIIIVKLNPYGFYGTEIHFWAIRKFDRKLYYGGRDDNYGIFVKTENDLSKYLVQVSEEEKRLIKEDKIPIDNSYSKKSIYRKEWYYSELVKIFGEENISFERL
jgi:hypothetical protein